HQPAAEATGRQHRQRDASVAVACLTGPVRTGSIPSDDRDLVRARVVTTKTVSNAYELLDPEVLNRVGHLDILSRTVVDGLLAGKHRSIQRGGTFEFAEHRAYAAG